MIHECFANRRRDVAVDKVLELYSKPTQFLIHLTNLSRRLKGVASLPHSEVART